MMTVAVVLLGALGMSAIGTAAVRRYAIARSILDVPNHRSSHSVPTPRGGGVAIVAAFLAGTVTFAAAGLIAPRLANALLGAGSLVAIVGFLDDHRHIAARWRLLSHFTAAAWALAWMGGIPPISIGGAYQDLGIAGDLLTAVALVWLLNLYNFMDGIDGIAGIETVTACVGAIVIYSVSQDSSKTWYPAALLAMATLGFLVWNFPPAKIFMGDAGSGFLGITLGVLALDAAIRRPEWLWSWIMLLGAFVVDATVTLFVRLSRGEKLYEAHRSHAYQHAAQRYRSHRTVTLAVAAINLLWLLPIALLAGTGRIDGLLATVIAYVPLVWLALVYRAGRAPASQATAPSERAR
jgi:Fuc2NAc and GlcNAc transferase